MTDGWLMDADCVHGNAWYQCRECAAWDDGVATRRCPQCGVPAGVECVPAGNRPHRRRYEPGAR